MCYILNIVFVLKIGRVVNYINMLKKQNKPLAKFDGLMWGSLLESAIIKDKDTIVF